MKVFLQMLTTLASVVKRNGFDKSGYGRIGFVSQYVTANFVHFMCFTNCGVRCNFAFIFKQRLSDFVSLAKSLMNFR